MPADFHPCPTCPEDFTTAEALSAHQATCKPRTAAPAKPKREDTGGKFEALIRKSAKAQDLNVNQSHVRRGQKGQRRGVADLDFYGHLAGRYFTFDAKSTRKLPFRLELIKAHQAVKAKHRHTEGAIAGFVIELAAVEGGPVYLFAPWPVFEPYWKGGRWVAPSVPLAELRAGCVEIRRRGRLLSLLDLSGAIATLAERRTAG